MIQNRRSFLKKAMTAAACSLTPPLVITSCLGDGVDPLTIDFIGSPERFDYFRGFFRKIKMAELVHSTFEESAESSAGAVFLEDNLSMKATYAVILIEQGKDIISSYPIAQSLSEYNSIQKYLLRHDRRLGLINPLLFYPSVLRVNEMAGSNGNPPGVILISCNPSEIVPGYSIGGISGPAQFLQGMVSYFSNRYPVSLIAENTDSGIIGSLQLDYSTFQARIVFDQLQVGWTMDVGGKDFTAKLDHTGLLAIEDEVQPRVKSSEHTWELAMILNLEDFIKAVQSRSEPMLSSLDGLASIILNRAAEESLLTGRPVNL